jgi:CheY-like chemotaxis protein
VNDILDFSKIEAGKLDLDEEDFNLRDCLEETLKPLALRAEEKKIELLCDIAPQVPELARGDANRLRQVALNLLGNAIKFTHSGEVMLRVEFGPSGNEAQVAHFIVSDTGIGIPPEKLKFIFDPFTQADASTTRKYGGTGLGLTISARLVTMMGGRIWVESEPGKGSCFHFTVPLKFIASRAKTDAPAGESGLRGLRVLIVDDNVTNRKILQGLLERWELRTQPVEGGEQAVKELIAAHAAGDPYRLILTDLKMPGIDGFALVERVLQRPQLKAMAIMMLSSSGYREGVERCRQLGISAYLVKPVRKDELLAAIQTVFAATQPGRPAAEPATGPPRSPEERLHILLAEDNRVNQTVASRMLERMGHAVVVANHGREALALLAKQTFDLVLMDVQMPEMDGLTATRNIREAEKRTGAHLPIIAMTAHAMKGDREHCLEAGVDDYLPKPVNARALMDSVAAVIGARGGREVRPVKRIQERVVSGTQALWDFHRTLEQLGGDESLLREVIDIFLVETPKKIASLRQALEQEDADCLERTAHSLKGELGYLGLPEVSQKARELEQMGRKRDLQNAATLFAALHEDLSAVLAAMHRARGGDHERTATAASGASA